jgi:LuxR family maltose regulon positive regulatory protein
MYALGYLATIAAEAGELHEAEARVRTGWRAAQDPTRSEHFVAMALQLAHGRIRERRGQLDEADAATRRAVVLARRGASTIELADALLASARIRAALGDWDGRRELLAEARRAVERCPDPGILANRLAAAERHRQPGARARPASPVLGDEPLSDRELDVLRLLPSGLSQREIAEALYVSQNTVKTHTRGIYRKLGASSRAEAVARARTLRLV